MNQISEMEEKPFRSSVNIYPEDCCREGVGAGGVTPLPLITTLIPSCSVDISFKDDVTVILLLAVSFMVASSTLFINLYFPITGSGCLEFMSKQK